MSPASSRYIHSLPHRSPNKLTATTAILTLVVVLGTRAQLAQRWHSFGGWTNLYILLSVDQNFGGILAYFLRIILSVVPLAVSRPLGIHTDCGANDIISITYLVY